MSTFIILQQMAVIAILVLVGVYLQKKDIIDEHTARKLSTIVMDIVNPALIMSCILSGNITATHEDLLRAIGVCIILYAFLCLFGYFISKFLPVKKEEQKFYNLMTVYTNVGFIGIPVAKAVLSDSAILYVIVCNIMFCLLFYTHGIFVLSGTRSNMNLKNMLSPGTVMSTLSLIVFWFGLSFPPVISNSIIYIGNATVFLSMALLGTSIAKTSIRDGLREKGLWIYIVFRMLAVPVVLVCILKVLHFQTEMVQAFCLMAAMPVANLPLIQAEKMGEKTNILSNGIMVTTVLCFITITLFMSLLF